MLKLKVAKLKEWPKHPDARAIPPCKYAETTAKTFSLKDKSTNGVDSRPWKSTKVAAYDKQK